MCPPETGNVCSLHQHTAPRQDAGSRVEARKAPSWVAKAPVQCHSNTDAARLLQWGAPGCSQSNWQIAVGGIPHSREGIPHSREGIPHSRESIPHSQERGSEFLSISLGLLQHPEQLPSEDRGAQVAVPPAELEPHCSQLQLDAHFCSCQGRLFRKESKALLSEEVPAAPPRLTHWHGKEIVRYMKW